MTEQIERPTEPLLERIIATVIPAWGASRAMHRRAKLQHDNASLFLRQYEAATPGRRTKGWKRPATSANAEIRRGAPALRNGARQLVRDNGHAANAMSVLTANVIGTGIQAELEAESDAQTKRLSELWARHMEQNVSGAESSGNFYHRQALGFRAVVESGAVLARRRRRVDGNLPLPYQVQLMEPDLLATYLSSLTGTGDIYQGKEYDSDGDVIAYHLHRVHPGDSFFGAAAFRSIGKTIRVDAAEIAHVYRVDRPGQVDGVSWLAPIMTDLRDLADTRDAYQLRQKIAACFTAFVTEPELGSGLPASQPKVPIGEVVEPGRIESLPLGKDVQFARPPGVEGMSDFDKAQLMTIAAGIGMPYEALTGDLRNVSFLSGRMGWLAFYRHIDAWRSHTVIPQLCDTEARWFLEACALTGAVTGPVRVTWTAPHRDLLDPLKEIKALREEMRLGMLSYADAARMRGRNPEVVLDSWETWAKKVDKRGLVFDWDPRQVALSGTSHDVMTEETGNAGSSRDD